MNEKTINTIWWIASSMTVAMYFSYIDQIMRNLSGHKGSIILPIITSINCLAWILYASLKQKKEWPIIICNIPWVILWIVSAFTAI